MSSRAAWACLEGCVRYRDADGTVRVPDSLGREHRLAPIHPRFADDALAACAFDDGGGRAVVSAALVEAIVAASFGLWCNPGFEPTIGDPGRIDFPPVASGIPFGFEKAILAGDPTPDERAMMQARCDWLDAAIRGLCADRRAMAGATAHQAVRWIWAHELGHLLGGHHLLGIGGHADVQARFGEPSAAAPARSEAQLALEILADRSATQLLVAGLRRAPAAEMRAFAIGGLLALSLFETAQVFSGRSWVTTTHPGNWFRGEAFLDQINAGAGRPLDWLPMLVRLAGALGHCGLWLAPAIEGDARGLADRFVADALAGLSPHMEALRAGHALLIADHEGLSTDLYRGDAI